MDYLFLATDQCCHIIPTAHPDLISIQEETVVVGIKFFDSLSAARQYYYKNYDSGLNTELVDNFSPFQATQPGPSSPRPFAAGRAGIESCAILPKLGLKASSF